MSYLRQVFAAFAEDKCTTLAAAISYYTVFALPPLLYLLMMVVTAGLSVAYDSEIAEEKAEEILEEQATQLLGDRDAANGIAEMIERSRQAPGAWWKALIGIAGVLLGATGLLGAVQVALNLVWAVKPDPDRSRWKYVLRKRVVSFALVLGLGLLLLASIAASGVIAYLGDQMEALTGIDPLPASWITSVLQTLLAFIVFAVIYKVVPDAVVSWRDVGVGALVATILFVAGRIAIQQYFAFSPPGARLGEAAASLAAIFVWVYYTAMILLFGAEATEVFARRSGRGVRPTRRSVRVVQTLQRDPS